MKLLYKLVLLLLLSVCSNISFAQFQGQIYKYDTTIKIFANGKQQRLAWCGGFNSPQFAMADLNHDGKQDLVIYERGNIVRTFINTGTASNPNYVFAPEFAVNFPEVDGSIKLIDYNCDGIPDLITTPNAFTLFKGYYNSKNQLCFTHYKSLFYTNDTDATGPQNAFVSQNDIPAVVDVDHDGDLDFLSFDVFGNQVYWYKNVQVEEGLPCDSVRIKLKDKCWGKFYQVAWLTNRLGYNCDAENNSLLLGPGEKTTHSGNTMCLLDMDGDGDYDMLDGNVGFNNIVYLQNGKYPYSTYDHRDSMVYQDTTWNSAGYAVNMPTYSTPYFVDIDQDGKRDLLVSPNSKSSDHKCILFLKNIGTDSIPVFQYQTDTFLIDQTIDVGTGSYPMFYDYNKDGRPDLFIGSDGYYQPDGTYKARISYYLNTSKPDTASFVLQTTDFLNLSSYNFKGTALSVGDIDNDGKDDLIIGHTNGTLSYFKNTASANNVQPDWQLGKLTLTDQGGKTINVGGNAAPFVYDLDKDGKPDLLIGAYSGYIAYYRNMSAIPGQVNLKLVNQQIGNIKTDKVYAGYSVPFVGKLDSSGVDYILVGSNSGRLYRYTGFQKGDTAGIYQIIDSNYSFIDSAYLSITGRANYDGYRSAPAIADVDGNGKLELVVGNIYGGLILYEQDSFIHDTVIHLGTPQIQRVKQVKIYPNPTSGLVTLSWNNDFARAVIDISVVAGDGKIVLRKHVNANATTTEINTHGLSPGVYYFIVQSEINREMLEITVVK
jgi:hypothetical protein